MDLKEQKYVCTLADCKNLTKAAEKLYISQPALSMYISNLEKTMGVKLFDRSDRRFSLTFIGQKYVDNAKKMLEQERIFNAELHDILLERLGIIRLGISPRRATWLLPPVIAEYEKQWPGIDVRIQEGNITDLNELLKNQELDMIVCNKYDLSKEMEQICLFYEEFLLAVSPLHPINERAQYVPGERYRMIDPRFLDEQVLILNTPFQSSRLLEDTIIERHHIHPSKIRMIRSSETAIQMAAEGLGIAFAREGFARHIRYNKPINFYTINSEQHKREVVAAYRKDTTLPEYMRAFLDLLVLHSKDFLKY